jgi:hypothetical protein
MPEYKFKNHTTGKTWLETMTISQRTEFLAENPDVEQLVHGAPRLVRQVNSFGHKLKPDDEFRSKLKAIKKANPGSTIDTYALTILCLNIPVIVYILGVMFAQAWFYLPMV